MVIPREGFFYPTLTRIRDSFFARHCFFLFKNKLTESPKYASPPDAEEFLKKSNKMEAFPYVFLVFGRAP